MKKILVLLAMCVLFSACEKTYTYEEFYNDPEMAKAYIEMWQHDPKANQKQVALARDAYTAYYLKLDESFKPTKPFEVPTFGSGKNKN